MDLGTIQVFLDLFQLTYVQFFKEVLFLKKNPRVSNNVGKNILHFRAHFGTKKDFPITLYPSN